MIFLQIAESIALPDGSAPVDIHLLEEAASQTILHTTPELAADLTLVLTDDAQIHELDRQFLGIDAPTDVLSFPGGDTDPDTQTLYLGDVIISYPRALAQATAGGHPVEAELQLLTVHGALHLLGYDHGTPQEQAAMWKVQAEILALLGCPIHGPSE